MDLFYDKYNQMKTFIYILLIALLFGCKQDVHQNASVDYLPYSKNILDYRLTPKDSLDKSGLIFSDQGAWFAYSLQEENHESIGFKGPFLMTQQKGIWLCSSFTDLTIKQDESFVNLKKEESNSYSSHLEQSFSNSNLVISQKLVYRNGHTALLKTKVKNTSNQELNLQLQWGHSPILIKGISLAYNENLLEIHSEKTPAIGHLKFPEEAQIKLIDSLQYTAQHDLTLKPDQHKEFIISQSFIFPEYSWEDEKKHLENLDFESTLKARQSEKNRQLEALIENLKPQFQDSIYAEVLAKAHLTLQNNWRIPAGEIKHEGLFPSYHYKWFNGFWSWDSWKHAVGLSFYDTDLAKKQMKLMFEFQDEDGFVTDVVYREGGHNYRDTKPPLSGWAVAKIFEKDQDTSFITYMYPKLKKYHYWWYQKRDHDQDGLCEYGSTDGSLIAAKWESGMDNAIRFDNSKIVKNVEGAYSLDQESVDLNAYLYAEKLYLAMIAKALGEKQDEIQYKEEAEDLKIKIQQQFFDTEDGWFYDTNLEGDTFIKGEGSEGWTALWAKAASQEQAASVKNLMMDSKKFFTTVPFQTMSADHSKFNPLRGYWRGPNWLDQAYFGVKSLRNYGFNSDADKATIQILKGAEGILDKGKAIRENYHPLTGQGLNAKNFSWSAAHIIMLLMND
ncbi:trehalase [Flavobacteriaceae bacterium AU392]|nr:trehalase [Flavobacteriaceae bacterium]RKM84158.1 trehalase [Flavobacteriaceae bacterium AU392]